MIVGGIIGIVALAVALMFESVYRVSVEARPVVMSADADEGGTAAADPLPLRLVDSGGVGIPFGGSWGHDYSHDRRTFRDVIREAPPYVDTAAFDRVDAEWRAYVERMLEYGNNAMAVPLLLELIDFDRVAVGNGSPIAGTAPVYEQDSPFRARHAEVRRHFASLFEWTDRRGMRVFLDTDMLTLTPPLARYLGAVAPRTDSQTGAQTGAQPSAAVAGAGIDATSPAVWDAYRAGLEELFDRVPSVSGLVIRFGEGGSLYNTEGWPYRSEMAIRSAAGLRAMLRGLLPVFEARGKTLVLRSWTVGVGPLGRLHVDPDVYRAVLDEIDSPALVISTKYTEGDFFSYLPLNRTLAAGRHRRIIELQAKPEFEGFGAFPDFLGMEYARALRRFRAANPRIAGTYLLTQFGGPLRAGPRTLYPFHGFWLWTDANVFVASRLAIDSNADVRELIRAWAEMRFGHDPRIADAVTTVLTETRKAVLEGFYIRSFAERQVRVPGLDLPPLMWIFEWDMVGGWHSLLSLVYRGTRDHVDLAIAEGEAAAAAVRRARETLHAACAAAGAEASARVCGEALRSLDYQMSLFDALAAWRRTFLSYYRWLDTGDPRAWDGWRAGKEQFRLAADSHLARFGDDLGFPAFDFTSARRAVTVAERDTAARALAATVVTIALAMLLIGSPLAQRHRALAAWWRSAPARIGRLAWTAAITPWRLTRGPVDSGAAIAIAVVALVLMAVLVGILSGFASVWIAIGPSLLFAMMAVTFEWVAMPVAEGQRRGLLLAASAGSWLPALIFLLAVVAWLGPVGMWYGLWMVSTVRVMFVAVVVAMLLWPIYVTLACCSVNGWRATAGAWLAATGVVLLGLTAMLPDWVHVLRSLDRPLNIAPATDTMVFALRTYAGVSLDIAHSSRILGALLLAGGALVRVTLHFTSSTSQEATDATHP